MPGTGKISSIRPLSDAATDQNDTLIQIASAWTRQSEQPAMDRVI